MVVGTAGHVDHGKTALVKALTGIDTDRLPEEKAREISIEIGFAPLVLTNGTTCSLVDVPGHERFIRNMLAGVTGVDVFLLAVDAAEGIMPQTREHLDILHLLGVTTGVIALTKVDTVDASTAAQVGRTLKLQLEPTPFAGTPIVPVSAVAGQGLEELRNTLAEAVKRLPFDRARGSESAGSTRARLPIDRAFHVAGFGTVVTGTVAAGLISRNDRLIVYPRGREVRVRGLECHGRPVDSVRAGDRAALNLAEVGGGANLRGSVLAASGSLRPSRSAGLRLRMLPSARSLRDLERVRLHAGTAEHLGRLALLPGHELAPGSEAPVVFESEQEMALAEGEPFIIRTLSPARTVGGGTVTIPNLADTGEARPRGRAGRERAARLIEAPRRTVVLSRGMEVEEPEYRAVAESVQACLRQAHRVQPYLHSVGREVLWSLLEGQGRSPAVWLETFTRDGVITPDGRRVRLPGWKPVRPSELQAALTTVEAMLRSHPFTPPGLEEMISAVAGDCAEATPGAQAQGARASAEKLVRQALEILLIDGRAVAPTGGPVATAKCPIFHHLAVEAARCRVVEYLGQGSGSITVSEFRDIIGATRKYALPLLEYLDRTKVTLRRGDLRALHPSLGGHHDRAGDTGSAGGGPDGPTTG